MSTVRALLRLLATALDRLMATPPNTWESVSWGTDTRARTAAPVGPGAGHNASP